MTRKSSLATALTTCYCFSVKINANHYRFLPHTADIKIRADGKTRAEAFANAALALRECICGDTEIRPVILKRIAVTGNDIKSLLCAFLGEFLYLLDSDKFLLAEVRNVRITGHRLVADAFGDDAAKYDFSNSVKAVTYSEMFVRKRPGGWLLQFVLDV